MIISVMCSRGVLESINIFTDNVSLSGMKFISQKALEEGETVTLHICLHPGGETLTARARVVWLKALGRQQFEGGVEISEMDGVDRQRWADFISQNKVEMPMASS